MSDDRKGKKGLSRRRFMKGFGTSVVTASTLSSGLAPLTGKEASAQGTGIGEVLGPDPVPITLQVNGETHTVEVEPRETLLEVLRNRLDITGPKLICGQGACGGCTVYLNGKTAYSCMTLAIEAQGKEITTIEALAQGEKLHPVQEAFVEEDAVQCGFCTPGFVMSMAATLRDNPAASIEEVKEGISGHVCRCGSYNQIFKAAETAKKKIGG